MTLTTDELQKLLDAATPGPWGLDQRKSWNGSEYVPKPGYYNSVGPLDAEEYAGACWIECKDADAQLMIMSPDLARELIAARAKNAAAESLAEALRDFATAKIDALRYQPAYGESPEDEPDPVVEADYVWALQADAKGAIAAWDAAA